MVVLTLTLMKPERENVSKLWFDGFLSIGHTTAGHPGCWGKRCLRRAS